MKAATLVMALVVLWPVSATAQSPVASDMDLSEMAADADQRVDRMGQILDALVDAQGALSADEQGAEASSCVSDVLGRLQPIVALGEEATLQLTERHEAGGLEAAAQQHSLVVVYSLQVESLYGEAVACTDTESWPAGFELTVDVDPAIPDEDVTEATPDNDPMVLTGDPLPEATPYQ